MLLGQRVVEAQSAPTNVKEHPEGFDLRRDRAEQLLAPIIHCTKRQALPLEPAAARTIRWSHTWERKWHFILTVQIYGFSGFTKLLFLLTYDHNTSCVILSFYSIKPTSWFTANHCFLAMLGAWLQGWQAVGWIELITSQQLLDGVPFPWGWILVITLVIWSLNVSFIGILILICPILVVSMQNICQTKDIPFNCTLCLTLTLKITTESADDVDCNFVRQDNWDNSEEL